MAPTFTTASPFETIASPFEYAFRVVCRYLGHKVRKRTG
jgi:hypothetical protein